MARQPSYRPQGSGKGIADTREHWEQDYAYLENLGQQGVLLAKQALGSVSRVNSGTVTSAPPSRPAPNGGVPTSRVINTLKGIDGGGDLSADRTLILNGYDAASNGNVPTKNTAGGLNWGTLGIGSGGTGQTTANTALNALLPTQTGNNGKVLGTNGTNTSWVTSGGTPLPQQTFLYVTGSAGQTVSGQTFTTIAMPTVVTDAASAYNNSTYIYTVPQTGTYVIEVKLRLPDNTAAGIGWGIGANTSNIDGPWFMWTSTVAASGAPTLVSRNLLQCIRTARFNVGDPIRAYVFYDISGGPFTIDVSEMTIYCIGN